MKTSEQLNSIAEALSKAQGEFTNPEKNRTVKVKTRDGGSYSFAYATLDQILEITRPILSKNGLSVVQVIEKDEGLTLTSRLLHGSGQWIESNLPLHVEGDGVQALGSAISYLRRYGIISLLGLAAEEDDDGNHSDGNQSQGQDRQPRQGHQQPQRQQEQRHAAPKAGPNVSGNQTNANPTASPTTNTGVKPSQPTAPGGDTRPRTFDSAKPKEYCGPWFDSLHGLEGDAFSRAVWKHAGAKWELRFETLRDITLACEAIRKVMGDKPGSELIGSIVNGFTMDPDGLQQIRAELTKASMTEAGAPIGKG